MYDAVIDQLPESQQASVLNLPATDTVQDRYQAHGTDLLYSAKTGERSARPIPAELADEPVYTLQPPVSALVPDHCTILDVVDGRTWTYPGDEQYTDMALNAFDRAYQEDIPIRYPSNIRDTLEDRYQEPRVDRIMDGLEELGDALDHDAYTDELSNYPDDLHGDVCIAAAAEDTARFHESPVIMTNDTDFTDLADDYDIQPMPAVYANRALR